MKKLKMYVVLALVAICAGLFALPVFADENFQQLETPSWVRWDESNGLYVTFEEIEAADGKYRIEVYRNGNSEENRFFRYNPSSDDHREGRMSMWNRIYDSGSYTFRVQAVGNSSTTSDSEWSEFSRPYVYEKPALKFGKVQNLHWSETEAGVVTWDPPENMKDIPEEYRKSLRYNVGLLLDGEKKTYMYNITDNFFDMSGSPWMDEEGTYIFTVQAQSRDIKHVTHGETVESEEYLDTGMIIEDISGQLDDIYLRISSEDEDGNLASPSDALEAVEELDLKETAVAVQINESALSALSDIENKYLELSGKSVDKNISEDTGLNDSNVDVYGAGLNIASASNAIEIEIKKPDPNKTVEVDDYLYSDPWQYEISLKNAIKTLRAPITIVMPVPENIEPERLRILHYHNDGSSEVIWPFITDDGRARFTVTEFSIFAFVKCNEFGASEDDEPEIDNPGHSGGSGGGGGSSSGVSSSAGTTTTDAKKGRVNSVTGIIIGTGDEYSKWISEVPQGQAESAAVRWKLQYADGTFAVGTYVTDEQGNPVKDAAGNLIEQPLWELIGGAWYAFGADGYAKSGMMFDPTLGAWFYLDINSGMKTGWQQIDGKWYYFNPMSDGTRGKMAVSTTIDGYTVDENGVWVQ